MPQTPPVMPDSVVRIAVFDLYGVDSDAEQTGGFICDRLIYYLSVPNRGVDSIVGDTLRTDLAIPRFVHLRTNIYSVLNRSVLRTRQVRAKLGAKGEVDSSMIALLAEKYGVGLVLFGNCSVIGERKMITVVGLKGLQVQCPQISIALHSSLQLVDPREATVLKTETLSTNKKEPLCYFYPIRYGRLPRLAEAVALSVAWKYANLIAPYYDVEKFEFMKINDSTGSDIIKGIYRELRQLSAKQINALADSLLHVVPPAKELFYDAGILFEITGNFHKAQELYAKAAALSYDPRVKNAHTRIRNRLRLAQHIKSTEALRNQPIPVETKAVTIADSFKIIYPDWWYDDDDEE